MVARLIARFALAVPFAALTLASCEHNPGPPDALVSISVTRNPDTLAINTSRLFTARGTYASGATAVINNPVWSVAASGGAINASGVFTAATTPGTFVNTVRATVGSVSGNATVTVLGGAAASIVVSPNPQSLAVGATQQYTAVIRDAASNILAITPNWSVVAGGGSINSAGLFTAGNVAATFNNTVVASVGAVAGSATVTVTAGPLAFITVTPNPKDLAVGGAQQFAAAGTDASGNSVPVTPVWSAVAGGGTITAAGLFTAGNSSGVFANTVKATSGSVSGFATVTVSPGALATITVTPNPVTMATGTAQQFAAVGRDGNGNIIPISPSWAVVNGGGTINTAGLFTAGGTIGAFPNTVRATSGSIDGFATVNVIAPTGLAAITITPNPANVLVGGTVQFIATGLDNNGAVVPFVTAPTWSVVPSVGGGTINSGSGLFTAGSVDGTFTNAVQATSAGISGFATVIVSSLPALGPSLGAAETHGILAGTAVTCAGAPGTVNADASVWPGSAFTGFPPCTITGARHAADAFAQTAQGDLTTAFLALAAMPCGTVITANLGGTTLAPGVYCSTTSVGVTGVVTLNGPANALFVIRAASSLVTAGSVVLTGGAQAKNVYWWVGSSATLGTASAWQGNILALTSITLVDNATLIGRALARNGAVSLGTNNSITLP